MSYFAFQTLLRARENEVQSLQKEISCLQNEVQFLTKVYFMISPLELSQIIQNISKNVLYIRKCCLAYICLFDFF